MSQADYEVNGCIFEVGKYPGRTNEIPPAHLQAGLSEGRQIVPLDAAGEPDPGSGLIGVLSIGVSNVLQEFRTFRNEQIEPLEPPDLGGLNGSLVFVNGGKKNKTLCEWEEPPELESTFNPWGNIFINRLPKGRQPGLGNADVVVDPLQIQVLWIKGHGRFIDFCRNGDCDCAPDLCGEFESLECDPPGEPIDPGAGTGCQFPNSIFDAQDGFLLKFQTVLATARELFPNLRQAFISNRLYTGYAGDFDSCDAVSPEPWAYQNGFMVKALIGRQIAGLMPFGDDGAYPWIAWGPEFWGNGTLDGWYCYHLCADGLHPSSPAAAARYGYPESGQSKLAGMLMDFFQTDAVASQWFLAAGPAACPGDVNGDGAVDPLDAGFVLARYGCPVGTGDPGCDIADTNVDGFVDPLDVGYVLARFGLCD
ncbi:MAG: hypothetical protein IH988_02150 [Planctomycetes bacterium]|nr:hypothetical protein [Planctomycetota bacterium]